MWDMIFFWEHMTKLLGQTILVNNMIPLAGYLVGKIKFKLFFQGPLAK